MLIKAVGKLFSDGLNKFYKASKPENQTPL